MKLRTVIPISLSLIIYFFTIPIFAKQSWQSFLQDIRQEAIHQGIRPEVVDQAFNGLNYPSQKILNFDRSQPERRITFTQYRNTRADAFRINLGKIELRKHQQLFSRIAQRYGVSECFIVSLWGLETSYGNYMGTFPVIYSLATLAYDSRRSAFFRKELLLALHILNDGHVPFENFKGEWAGASGHPQFLPSSWHDYAVDYDGDGYKDIWDNLSDALASIANYLHQNGWNPQEPWAIPVILPTDMNQHSLSLDVSKTISQWQQMGVRPQAGESFPNLNYHVSIIQPNGGPALMIFNNFRVIMKWNHSTYYAGTVGYMAEKICQKRIR